MSSDVLASVQTKVNVAALQYSTGVGKLTEYDKKRLFGRILRKSKISASVAAHVDTKCCLWIGHRDDNGYGRIRVCRSGNRATRLLHRVVYEIAIGPAGDMVVMHRCDVTSCFRPDHLRLGTQLENIEDAVQKKRNARGDSIRTLTWQAANEAQRGEGNVRATHVKEQVMEIVELDRQGKSRKEISNITGESLRYISRILLGDRWSHITNIKPDPNRRRLRGSAVGCSKLCEKDIQKVFEMKLAGASNREISRVFNVSGSTIDRVIKGEIWFHVDIGGLREKVADILCQS